MIVVTGAGRGFCAGADMQQLQALGDGNVRRAAERAHERRPQTFPLSIPKPIIAAINGAVRRHRPGAGADVRPALRRRGGQADDRVRAPRPGRRARHLVDAAAADRTRAGARPAALRAGACSREEAQRSGLVNRVLAPEQAARGDARLRARARRQLLAGEHGDDEAAGLRRPRARPPGRARRGRQG